MKKLMSFLIITLLTIIMVSCDLFTPRQDTVAKLVLVPLTTESIAKAYTDDVCQMWLPESEIPNALAKASIAGIDFGDIKATRTLQYVIMNVEDQDVYDINFTANDLNIYPKTIGLIQASEQGTEVSALPIVNIVKEHVMPVEGVGALLNMEIGNFTDSLSLNYSYTTGNDTIDVSDGYGVIGQKMGVMLDWFCEDSTFELMDYFFAVYESNGNKGETRFKAFSSEYFNKLSVVNNGNSPIDVYAHGERANNIAIDVDSVTTLVVGDTLNMGLLFTQIYTAADSSIGTGTYNYVEFGPTSGIIKSLERYYLGGWLTIRSFIYF